jgi:hypothetical protein
VWSTTNGSPLQYWTCYDGWNDQKIAAPQQCGLAVGQPACGGLQCLAVDPTATPPQPLKNINGVCQACGFIGQPTCVEQTPCQTGMASGSQCVACGDANQAPCPTGCHNGLVSARDSAVGGNVCVSACGSVGQLPCTNGPTDTQNDWPRGGCTQWDAILPPGARFCQWPTTCGNAGQGCCDAGSFNEKPDATHDLCHDGSLCNYDGIPPLFHWQCDKPSSGGAGGGGGCIVLDQPYYEYCSGQFVSLPPVQYCKGSSPVPPAAGAGCVVYPGLKP